MTLIDEDGVEDVNKGFVHEEGFEEKGDDSGPFTKDKERGIKPCKMAVENCQEGDLVMISFDPLCCYGLTDTWGRYVQMKRLVRTKSDRRALGRRRARRRGHKNG